MSTATLHPVASSEHRTSRPLHFTSTGRSVPVASLGISIVNCSKESTAMAPSMQKRMPPAEMLIVLARYSSVAVFNITSR
jgi:hypothetical protein